MSWWALRAEEGDHLWSSSHQTAATPYMDTKEAQEWKNTGYFPQIAEKHMKAIISMSPDSYIFPYIDKP